MVKRYWMLWTCPKPKEFARTKKSECWFSCMDDLWNFRLDLDTSKISLNFICHWLFVFDPKPSIRIWIQASLNRTVMKNCSSEIIRLINKCRSFLWSQWLIVLASPIHRWSDCPHKKRNPSRPRFCSVVGAEDWKSSCRKFTYYAAQDASWRVLIWSGVCLCLRVLCGRSYSCLFSGDVALSISFRR